MLVSYWARFEGRTVGPHTLKILHELPGFGRDTLVCPAGEVVWRRAEEVEFIKTLLDAGSDEEVEEMLMSPKERRRLDRKQKARDEKEQHKRDEKDRSEEERKEKIKAMSSAEKGFNPMWIFLVLVIAGLSYAVYKNWKESQEPEEEIEKIEEVLPHPDRESHWAWMALGKTASEIEATYGKDSAEKITPDGGSRFEAGGDLGRWSRYEQVLILIPKEGAAYGKDDGIAALGIRGGKVRGAGRRYEAQDAEDMPRLIDALPKSFADEISPRVEDDNTWRLKWEIGRENWGALVMQNPGAEADVQDWRVKELWVTKSE